MKLHGGFIFLCNQKSILLVELETFHVVEAIHSFWHTSDQEYCISGFDIDQNTLVVITLEIDEDPPAWLHVWRILTPLKTN